MSESKESDILSRLCITVEEMFNSGDVYFGTKRGELIARVLDALSLAKRIDIDRRENLRKYKALQKKISNIEAALKDSE